MQSSQQNGNTMIEALSAIAVVTMFTIAGIGLISNMINMFREQVLIGQVQDIQKKVSERYRLEGNYADLSGKTAEQFEKELLIPAQMRSGNEIYHRMGGPVKIEVSDMGNRYFNITFSELTQKNCFNLSQMTWNNTNTVDLVRIIVNDKKFDLPVKGLKPENDKALPITLKKASESCKSGDENEIVWTFQ